MAFEWNEIQSTKFYINYVSKRSDPRFIRINDDDDDEEEIDGKSKDAIKCENGIENGVTKRRKRRRRRKNDFLKHVLIGWFIILVTLSLYYFSSSNNIDVTEKIRFKNRVWLLCRLSIDTAWYMIYDTDEEKH